MGHCLFMKHADLMPIRSQYLNLPSNKTISLHFYRAINQSDIPLRHIGADRHAVLWNLAAAEDLADSLGIPIHEHLSLGTDFGSRGGRKLPG